ncbi:MAG: pseudouridine-5'-phosphate glycosidase [Gemmataceae bacterium]|nr:pseudouridine-5'-phosphate glycosidase [Gemmataceae bacterium]
MFILWLGWAALECGAMLTIRPDVAASLREGSPVVALESTLISHGLPWPMNYQTAIEAEEVIRRAGVTPATIAILDGEPIVGLTSAEIERFASNPHVEKASRRDIAVAIAKRLTAATTVAGTMLLAARAGIPVFATGGIGGVHRGAEHSFDISSDLLELSRTPVAVVCAGAKSVLDIPKTLEMLETLGVPVLGFGTSTFPAFFLHSSGLPVQTRFDTAIEVAGFLQLHWAWGGRGVLIAQPVAEEVALSAQEFEAAYQAAHAETQELGPRVTPALLAKLANFTSGKTVEVNRELILANARLAASIALSLAKLRTSESISPANIA